MQLLTTRLWEDRGAMCSERFITVEPSITVRLPVGVYSQLPPVGRMYNASHANLTQNTPFSFRSKLFLRSRSYVAATYPYTVRFVEMS